MPHTTTKSYRPKRADTRPNGKLRRKLGQQSAHKDTIQDLRVTRTLKHERKEREVTSVNNTPLKTLSKDEKLIRALKKKLKSIHELMEKEKRGEALTAEQANKVRQADQVLHDIEELMKKCNMSLDDDEQAVEDNEGEK